MSITKYISNDVKRFCYIRDFKDYPRQHFTDIGNVKESVEASIEDIRGIRSTKVGRISRKRYVSKTS